MLDALSYVAEETETEECNGTDAPIAFSGHQEPM